MTWKVQDGSKGLSFFHQRALFDGYEQTSPDMVSSTLPQWFPFRKVKPDEAGEPHIQLFLYTIYLEFIFM